MKITLRCFADIREILGAKEQELSLPDGQTVGGLLKALSEAHPPLRQKLYAPDGTLRSHITILKNGRGIASLQQLDTPIDPGDVIALFPSLAGG